MARTPMTRLPWLIRTTWCGLFIYGAGSKSTYRFVSFYFFIFFLQAKKTCIKMSITSHEELDMPSLNY